MNVETFGHWLPFEPVTEPEPWFCDRCGNAPNLAEWEHEITGEVLCVFHFESEEA